MKSRIFPICLAVFMVMILPVQALTPEDLKAAIAARIKVTTTNVVGRILEPGTVLIIQQEGLRSDPRGGIPKASVIKNGALVTVGGGGFLSGLLTSSASSGRSLKVGERVYCRAIDTTKNSVQFYFITIETYDYVDHGTTKSEPFMLLVTFQYDNGIEGVTADQVLGDIFSWFKPQETGADTSKTISLGMSPEQVIAALGPPEKKVELGPKIIFVYKDMKVIFIDGKVADVQ